MARALILGCCSTGAKYTPLNHRPTGDAVMDRICTGADIPVDAGDVAREVRRLAALGVGYYHYHARDPLTREQTTDDATYREVGLAVRAAGPGMLVSYGASRNGPEVIRRIEAMGEWERVSHVAIPLEGGGAHFVTMQAAIELQAVIDLERGFGALTREAVDSLAFASAVSAYRPSDRSEEVRMETNSTANGANYGKSSPAIQVGVYGKAVAARRALGLWDEVEWVQEARSYAMTRMAIIRDDIALGSAGQLNVTILFGFSPKLPFPETYAEFRRVVALAKSLESDRPGGPAVRKVTVSVGAAVLPHHAARAVIPLDVGPMAGVPTDAIGRLVAYAAQDDSGVDVVRVGMEDTPYLLDALGRPQPTDNASLCEAAMRHAEANGADLPSDPSHLLARMPRLVESVPEALVA